MPEFFFPKIPYFLEDQEYAGFKLGNYLLKSINGNDVKKLQYIKKMKFINKE